MKKFGIILVLLLLAAIWVCMFFIDSDTEFAENDLYDEIISKGKIKIGINMESRPFGFYNKEGKPAGYDVDLARYVTQYILHDPNLFEIVPVTPSNRLIMASTGKVDIVISTVTITPQRQEIVSFSIPYDVAGQAILVQKRSAIRSLADLNGQTVGVIFGTTAEKNMQKMVPTANLRGFRSYDDAYMALKTGQINAITSDNTILSRYSMEDGSMLLLPRKYSQEPYGIAFKKGNSTKKLKENLDFIIKDLTQKNVIQRLRKQWGVGV